MAKEKHTTVNLTEKAQSIKDDLSPIFGLKNILSAGLILLGKLSAEQKQKIIAEANDVKTKPEPTITESIETLKTFIRYKIPSPEEQREIDSLRQLLEPEPKQKRKRG